MSGLKPHTWVEIQGLKKGKRYNGENAVINYFDETTGRYNVEVRFSNPTNGNKVIAVRPRNLKITKDHSDKVIRSSSNLKTKSPFLKGIRDVAIASTARKTSTISATSTTTSIVAPVDEEVSFFSSEKKKKIISHMNKDHSESLKAYLHFFNNMTMTTAAIMTDVDSRGMTVDVTLQDRTERKGIRIEFIRPLDDPADLRKMTVEMHKLAFKELGWESVTKDHPVSINATKDHHVSNNGAKDPPATNNDVNDHPDSNKTPWKKHGKKIIIISLSLVVAAFGLRFFCRSSGTAQKTLTNEK